MPVHLVASHDTASAYAAARPNAAVLSSGTWSLLGLELDSPRLDERAAGFNLTNERGVDGTIRLLRNVMGLWLLQECRREWGDPRYDELTRLAEEAPADVPLFDPGDDAFIAPGDMPARIAAACDRQPAREPGRAGPLDPHLARLPLPRRASSSSRRPPGAPSTACT